MRKTLLITLVALTLFGCNKKNIFEEERSFEGNKWNRFTPEVFEIDINNTEKYYNIFVEVAVDTGRYRYTSLPLTVNLYSPNSERRMFYAEVPLTESGRPKGEMAEGYRVTSKRIRNYFSFNSKGKHRMEIGQATSQYDLEGVHRITLRIEDAPIEIE